MHLGAAFYQLYIKIYYIGLYANILLFIWIGTLSAGDAAQFVTVGWSSDSQYYAFAQFGILDGSGFPYAELFIVDVQRNEFVQEGTFTNVWEDVDDTPANGLDVLIEVLGESDSMRKYLSIRPRMFGNFMNLCRNADNDTVKWKNSNQDTITIVCEQKHVGSKYEYDIKSSFCLKILVNNRFYKYVGNPERMRNGVIRYDIDSVLRSRDGNMFVIVIKKTELGFEGPSIRYMVETFTTNDL